mmetsp:Transcript_2683/g.4930  ORF Transcript_2683/g.4930 Transcript_2683/m.4930 type:complete len:313 (-) Transcript_2683:320-1258(-)
MQIAVFVGGCTKAHCNLWGFPLYLDLMWRVSSKWLLPVMDLGMWEIKSLESHCLVLIVHESYYQVYKLRKIPASLSFEQAAALPAVALTALYALQLAGHFPQESKGRNRAILIHSAAGGVGSMLVQMSKILGLSPVVGVVGKSSKVGFLSSLGCDVVIDKSTQDLWQAAREASPDGYAAIMDANGVSTLQQSYDHLAPTGRLIVFGFHSNLPMGRAALSPLEWIRMAVKMSSMPKFDPMDLTVSNKSVMGFNLSFFEKEVDLVSLLFDQVCEWLEQGKLTCPRIVEMDMKDIGEAHNLIMSGKSVGKIVIRT